MKQDIHIFRNFILLAMLIMFSIATFAQETTNEKRGKFSIKPYGGLTVSKLFGNRSASQFMLGFTAGADAEVMLTDNFGLSAGIAYSQQGGKQTGQLTYEDKLLNYDIVYNFDYINVPVLLNLYVTDNLSFKFGIQPGYAMKTLVKVSLNDEHGEVKPDANRFDIAFPIGISYEYKRIIVNAQYNVGALDVSKEKEDKEDTGHLTNGVFMFTVGYRL